jgi:hypothetical protein
MKNGIVGGFCVALLLVACKQQDQKQARPTSAPRPPHMPMKEIQRGHEACEKYTAAACACAKSSTFTGTELQKSQVQELCDQSTAYPGAITVALEVAAGSGVSNQDILQAQAGVRNIIDECFSKFASLPTLSCPTP